MLNTYVCIMQARGQYSKLKLIPFPRLPNPLSISQYHTPVLDTYTLSALQRNSKI